MSEGGLLVFKIGEYRRRIAHDLKTWSDEEVYKIIINFHAVDQG